MHPPLICFAIIYEGEGKVRTANGKLLDFYGADKLTLMKVLITVTQTNHPHRMKVLITVTQTDHPHRMKVLIKLFQKFAQVEGVKPSSRPQARNILGVSSLPSFLLCARGVKEESG